MPRSNRSVIVLPVHGNNAKKRKEFRHFMVVFKKSVELNATAYNKKIARSIVAKTKDAIETQRYNWHPLSERYLEDKKRGGYDERIYVRTGEFLSRIRWGVLRDGKIWAGVPPEAIHQDSGLPMRVLARILEFGANIPKKGEKEKPAAERQYFRIPPRPIWRPILAEVMRENKRFAKYYRNQVNKDVAKAMKKTSTSTPNVKGAEPPKGAEKPYSKKSTIQNVMKVIQKEGAKLIEGLKSSIKESLSFAKRYMKKHKKPFTF